MTHVFSKRPALKRVVISRDLEAHELDARKEYAGMARAYIREELRRIDGAVR